MDIYNRPPLQIINDIPVFTELGTRYINNYDKIAAVHLKSLAETGENKFGNKRYTDFSNNVYLSYINQYVKNTDFVLDAGVSVGDIAGNLNTPNKFGVDISINYLSIAKNKNINVCLAMLEDLPYVDNLFDVVLCKDVFEHVFDLYNCVKSIIRTLKKGGYLIFQVPYKQDLTVYLTYDEFEFVHVRNFDEASIILMFYKIFGCNSVAYAASYYDGGTNCDIIDFVIQK